MKTRTMLLSSMTAMLLLPMTAADAQNTDAAPASKLMLEAEVSTGLKQHGVTPIIGAVNVGWRLMPSLCVYARLQGMKALYEVDDERTFFGTQNIGGGVEYVLGTDKWRNNNVKWSLRAQVTNSIGNVDWKNTSYEAGIYIRYCKSCTCVSPYFGFGFRHINSHTTGIRDYNSIFGTVGFGF